MMYMPTAESINFICERRRGNSKFNLKAMRRVLPDGVALGLNPEVVSEIVFQETDICNHFNVFLR